MTKPSPIALVICDNVYREPGGKTALVGLFNNIRARKFPFTHNRICVFASITDIRPNTTFKLDIVHSETDESLVSLVGPPPKNADPTTICDFVFILENVTFREPHRYYIRFFGNEHVLLQRPFEVTEIKGGGND
ncbi:MAG: hypothetical protein JXQ75_05690 [Phycisphaerae bacterium]|nr:hypothetical protein [Phycisphaerae bacterium]